jgi:hypothetical protein
MVAVAVTLGSEFAAIIELPDGLIGMSHGKRTISIFTRWSK